MSAIEIPLAPMWEDALAQSVSVAQLLNALIYREQGLSGQDAPPTEAFPRTWTKQLLSRKIGGGATCRKVGEGMEHDVFTTKLTGKPFYVLDHLG